MLSLKMDQPAERIIEDDEMTERSMSPVLVTNKKGPTKVLASKPRIATAAAAEPAEHSQDQTVCSGDENVSVQPLEASTFCCLRRYIRKMAKVCCWNCFFPPKYTT